MNDFKENDRVIDRLHLKRKQWIGTIDEIIDSKHVVVIWDDTGCASDIATSRLIHYEPKEKSNE